MKALSLLTGTLALTVASTLTAAPPMVVLLVSANEYFSDDYVREAVPDYLFFEDEPVIARISLANRTPDEQLLVPSLPALSESVSARFLDATGQLVGGNRVAIEPTPKIVIGSNEGFPPDDVRLPSNASLYWVARVRTGSLKPGKYRVQFSTIARAQEPVFPAWPDFRFELRGVTPEDVPEVTRRQMLRAFLGNDFVSARTAATTLLQLNRGSIQANIVLGDMARATGDLAGARRSYAAALASVRADSDPLFARRATAAKKREQIANIELLVNRVR